MAALPLDELALEATSVATDLGFVALSDVATALQGTEARVIGGHMVQLQVQRWGLGAELYRETQDADLGVPLLAVKGPDLIERIKALGYKQVAGNRFARTVNDLPVTGIAGGEPRAVIDVLVPAHRTRARDNVRIGDHLTTTEVPGLAEAFLRPPVQLRLRLARMNRQALSATIAVPDEVSALVLKVLAWETRFAGKDAVDVWRCAEVLMAAGLDLSELRGKTADIVKSQLRLCVARRNAGFMAALIDQRNLSVAAGNAIHTRMRALVERLVPMGEEGRLFRGDRGPGRTEVSDRRGLPGRPRPSPSRDDGLDR